MNPNNNQPGQQNPNPSQQPQTSQPMQNMQQPVQQPYVESKSMKALQETEMAVGTVGMVAGVVATLKGLFGMK